MFSPRPTRFLAGSLALVLFGVNGPLANAAESNFWAERRKATKKSGTLNPAHILAQFPHASPVNFVQRPDTQMISGFPGSDPKPGILPKDWVSPLLPYGSIREVFQAKRPNAPRVIHIQDAHGIEEAQANVAAIIRTLGETHKVNLVGLEGATGPFTLKPYRDFSDPSITNDISAFFLKEGFIGGPEFAGLTIPKMPFLWGVEDMGLYQENIAAFHRALNNKPLIQASLRDYKTATEEAKSRIYSFPLKSMDRHIAAYRSGQEGLGSYVRALFGLQGGGKSSDFPNLRFLLQALAAEESLDFKRVETQRLALVEALARRLQRNVLDLLVRRSLEYRAGQTASGEYYTFLKNLCEGHGIQLESFDPLNGYIDYVLLAEKIDRTTLLNELDGLETKVRQSLAVTTEQKHLVDLDRLILSLEKLVDHAMTLQEWVFWTEHREKGLRLAEGLRALGARGDLQAMSPEMLKPFEDFCFRALQRNNALADNLLAKMKTEGATSAVLVAGGFHTDGLTSLFREKDISYLVVTPKISEVPKDNNYLDIFAHDTLPLDRLFEGETIFMVYPEALAESTLAMSGAPQKRAKLTGQGLLAHQRLLQTDSTEEVLGQDIIRKGPPQKGGRAKVRQIGRFTVTYIRNAPPFMARAWDWFRGRSYAKDYAKNPLLATYLKAPVGENSRIVVPAQLLFFGTAPFLGPVAALAVSGLWIVYESFYLVVRYHQQVYERGGALPRPTSLGDKLLIFMQFLVIGFGSLAFTLFLAHGASSLLTPHVFQAGFFALLIGIFYHSGMQLILKMRMMGSDSSDANIVWEALEKETPVMHESNQYDCRLYFLDRRLQLFVVVGTTHNLSISFSRLRISKDEVTQYKLGQKQERWRMDDIKIPQQDQERLREAVLRLLRQFENRNGIREMLGKLEREEAQERKMAALAQNYAMQPVTDETERTALVEELNRLFELKFEDLSEDQVERIQ